MSSDEKDLKYEKEIQDLKKRVKHLEEDLKLLKEIHKLPTHFGGKRIVKKCFNGNYALEGGGIGGHSSPESDY
jgi:hypothetical protein